MNKSILFLLCFFGVLSLNAQKHYCSFDEFLPAFDINDYKKTKNTTPDKSNGTVYLRTVVHVLHNQPNQNINVNTIENLIEDCNKILRAENVDLSQVHPQHHDLVSNTDIQLCLAKNDPLGNPTNGITHTAVDVEYFTGVDDLDDPYKTEMVKQDTLGGVSAWDTSQYFNIWIAPMVADSVWLNYGMPYAGFTFTGDILPGYIPGAVVDMSMMTAPEPLPVNIPSVVTHEIGHVLGLLHTWGNDLGTTTLPNCDLDDGIDDTPTCALAAFCIPNLNENTCTDDVDDKVDNVANVMNYACAIMFTPEQSNLMYDNLVSSGLDFLTTEDCDGVFTSLDETRDLNEAISVFPNPTEGLFTVKLNGVQSGVAKLVLHNHLGQIIDFQELKNKNTVNEVTFEVNKSGLYLLTLMTKQGAISKKVIIVD